MRLLAHQKRIGLRQRRVSYAAKGNPFNNQITTAPAISVTGVNKRVALAPSGSNRHADVVRRVHSARAALKTANDPEVRNTLLDELGAATRELTKLIVEKEGGLKSPLE